jgi:hypothetical protein
LPAVQTSTWARRSPRRSFLALRSGFFLAIGRG